MNILVFNCGSSSLNFKIFKVENLDPDKTEIILSGKAHRVGVIGSEPSFIEYHFKGNDQKKFIVLNSHQQAASLVLNYIKDNGILVDNIGHRFVHGGNYFNKAAFINKENLKKLKLCQPLAPIHNPIALSVILECKKKYPDVLQFVSFDSAFHSTLPDYAYTYLLPKKIVEKFQYRKYGFHGLSYSYVIKAAAQFLNKPLKELKIVACHLGTGGSSVIAIKNGSSMDTSMGYSPLLGLMMSTRSGDIDPMLTIYLMVAYGFRPDALLDYLNKRSGILGVSGFSSDIRDIVNHFSKKNKDEQPELAFNMFIHRLKKYIGSYIIILKGIDVLLFTDDIGTGNSLVREKVCKNMEWAGLSFDEELNKKAIPDKISVLNSKDSQVHILSVPNQEELVIVWEGIILLKEGKT